MPRLLGGGLDEEGWGSVGAGVGWVGSGWLPQSWQVLVVQAGAQQRRVGHKVGNSGPWAIWTGHPCCPPVSASRQS